MAKSTLPLVSSVQKPLSKEYKARAVLNLFITNTTPEQIATENIWSFHRLWWQVELIFKIWKSLAKIHEVKVEIC